MANKVGRPVGSTKFGAAHFIAAMENTGGILTIVAKKMGCHRDTVRRAIEKYPSVKVAYENEKYTIDDKAKSVVYKAIMEGDLATAKWWLTMKTGDEFAPRAEIDVTSNGEKIGLLDEKQHARSMDALTDALRTMLSDEGERKQSPMDTAI